MKFLKNEKGEMKHISPATTSEKVLTQEVVVTIQRIKKEMATY